MLRLLTLVALTLALAACSSPADTLPDFASTGQLVVAYKPAEQHVRLLEGECPGGQEAEPEGILADEAAGRLYYGLDPGAYCIQYGQLFSGGWLITGEIPVDIVAGAIEFVSVIPPRLAPG